MPQGCFIGNGNKMGEPIKVDSASDHIFGMVRGQRQQRDSHRSWGWSGMGPDYDGIEGMGGRKRGREGKEVQGAWVGARVS